MHSSLFDALKAEARTFALFHSWDTVGSFSTVDAEYDALIATAGLCDGVFVGRITVTGADRLDLLHRLSTNDLLSLEPGLARQTTFVTEKGRVIDSVTVAVEKNRLQVFVSSGNEERLIQWINKFTIAEDIQPVKATDDSIILCVAGAKANSAVTDYTGIPIEQNHTYTDALPPGVTCVVARSFGPSFLVYLTVKHAEAPVVWHDLLRHGTGFGIKPVGSIAFENFRISTGEAGFPGEISEQFNPHEVGLTSTLSFTKGCYVGQEIVARIETYQKVRRRLVGLRHSEMLKPFEAKLFREDGDNELGVVTSSSIFPVHGKHVSLAVVLSDTAGLKVVQLRQDGQRVGRGELVGLPMPVTDEA